MERKFIRMLQLIALFSSINGVSFAQNDYLTSPHAFLSMYSNSLLNGTYVDHANLYWDPTYFGGKWYNAAGIKKIAKNFYSKFRTLEHSFNVYDYGFDNEGYMVAWVVEYQKVQNRSNGNITSTATQKKFRLFFWKAWYCHSQEEYKYMD